MQNLISGCARITCAVTRTQLLWALIGIVVCNGILYAYFLNSAIVAVVERQELEEQAVNLSSRLSELEFDYIALQHNVTLEHAHTLGFVDAASPIFISRDPGGLTLSKELPLRP